MADTKKLLLSVSFALLAVGHPARHMLRQDSSLPAGFFLAGDSTTATAGGWGDCFLSDTLVNDAWGTNFAKSGATTVSFRNGGYWDSTIEAVKNASTNAAYAPWVTIQFGHNDQKEAANISIEEFSNNLAAFVDEVREAGGYPILVSSLSRRQYDGDKVIENLAEQANATLAVAKEKDALSIDLNRASTDYLNAIGSTDAYTYNLDSTDRTHLNDAGCKVFGEMVSWLLDNSDQADLLKKSTVVDDSYSEAFENETYISGED